MPDFVGCFANPQIFASCFQAVKYMYVLHNTINVGVFQSIRMYDLRYVQYVCMYVLVFKKTQPLFVRVE